MTISPMYRLQRRPWAPEILDVVIGEVIGSVHPRGNFYQGRTPSGDNLVTRWTQGECVEAIVKHWNHTHTPEQPPTKVATGRPLLRSTPRINMHQRDLLFYIVMTQLITVIVIGLWLTSKGC